MTAIASGKGGVGKTTVVANTAAVLATEGFRVLAVDADFGLANLALMLGVTPGPTLEDALEGRATLSSTLLEPLPGLTLVPGANGVRRLGALSPLATRALLDGIETLTAGFDLVLVDVAAGIAPPVLATLGWADDVVVVLGEDPASFVDAYAVLKLVLEEVPDKAVMTLVNRVRNQAEGEKLGRNLATVCERFLGRSPELAGVVPSDPALGHAVRSQRLVATEDPEAPSSRALQLFAGRVAAGARLTAARS